MLTLPKRLRAYFLHDRRRLGLLSRVAARTLRDCVQAALGEPDAVPGVIACVQTFGSLAHLHPHLHLLMTDGAFRRDGSFMALPPPDPRVLEEAWRRAVLAWFVRQGWLEEDDAVAMLTWPHSGFGAYLGPRIEDREGVLRVARYSARAPVAESRLRYHAERAEVELVSDRNQGPYAGVHRLSALEFLARWLDHVPERYEVRVRYSGAYATRRRVWWHRRGVTLVGARDAPPVLAEREPEPAWPALRARRRRWAELLRRVFAVEVEVCPRCGGAARILGFITEPAVITRILAHLAHHGLDARAGPWAGAAAAPG
ncbi:MAG TPA: transposase [Candidatus Eisenbacteria bacterium]